MNQRPRIFVLFVCPCAQAEAADDLACCQERTGIAGIARNSALAASEFRDFPIANLLFADTVCAGIIEALADGHSSRIRSRSQLPLTGDESGNCTVRATHYQWCSFTSHEAWGRTGAQNQGVDSCLAYNRRGDRRIRNQALRGYVSRPSTHENDFFVILEPRSHDTPRMPPGWVYRRELYFLRQTSSAYDMRNMRHFHALP